MEFPEEQPRQADELLQRASAGDAVAIAMLFEQQRPRLKKMVMLRMDRRLHARIDASDVLQDCWLDCTRRFPDFVRQSSMTFFHWLRLLAGQRLIDLHRKHLGASMRAAGQEVTLYRGALPAASSVSMAEHLLGRLTSASDAFQRAEIQVRIQEALNSMDAIDREVLVLRHFEMLTNEETAEALGLKKAAASNRHLRALKRLKAVLSEMPGSLE
jgi:RNA polymerase sigma-70 factor (ECF subfamily)